ncbi:MAG: hypothetical protein FD120_2783, partial [Gammaproteobacteria bacterium]
MFAAVTCLTISSAHNTNICDERAQSRSASQHTPEPFTSP